MGKERRVHETGSLTRERLMEVIHYDPLTGRFTWRLELNARGKVGSIAGYIADGYRRITIDRVKYRASRLAFLYMKDFCPEEVDHDNRIRDDDRWSNLKAATPQSNQRNKSSYKNNTSGITGVVFKKGCEKWQAQIHVNGVNKYIDSCVKFSDAVFARYCGELKYGWQESNKRTPAKVYVDKLLGRDGA